MFVSKSLDEPRVLVHNRLIECPKTHLKYAASVGWPEANLTFMDIPHPKVKLCDAYLYHSMLHDISASQSGLAAVVRGPSDTEINDLRTMRGANQLGLIQELICTYSTTDVNDTTRLAPTTFGSLVDYETARFTSMTQHKVTRYNEITFVPCDLLHAYLAGEFAHQGLVPILPIGSLIAHNAGVHLTAKEIAEEMHFLFMYNLSLSHPVPPTYYELEPSPEEILAVHYDKQFWSLPEALQFHKIQEPIINTQHGYSLTAFKGGLYTFQPIESNRDGGKAYVQPTAATISKTSLVYMAGANHGAIQMDFKARRGVMTYKVGTFVHSGQAVSVRPLLGETVVVPVMFDRQYYAVSNVRLVVVNKEKTEKLAKTILAQLKDDNNIELGDLKSQGRLLAYSNSYFQVLDHTALSMPAGQVARDPTSVEEATNLYLAAMTLALAQKLTIRGSTLADEMTTFFGRLVNFFLQDKPSDQQDQLNQRATVAAFFRTGNDEIYDVKTHISGIVSLPEEGCFGRVAEAMNLDGSEFPSAFLARRDLNVGVDFFNAFMKSKGFADHVVKIMTPLEQIKRICHYDPTECNDTIISIARYGERFHMEAHVHALYNVYPQISEHMNAGFQARYVAACQAFESFAQMSGKKIQDINSLVHQNGKDMLVRMNHLKDSFMSILKADFFARRLEGEAGQPLIDVDEFFPDYEDDFSDSASSDDTNWSDMYGQHAVVLEEPEAPAHEDGTCFQTEFISLHHLRLLKWLLQAPSYLHFTLPDDRVYHVFGAERMRIPMQQPRHTLKNAFFEAAAAIKAHQNRMPLVYSGYGGAPRERLIKLLQEFPNITSLHLIEPKPMDNIINGAQQIQKVTGIPVYVYKNNDDFLAGRILAYNSIKNLTFFSPLNLAPVLLIFNEATELFLATCTSAPIFRTHRTSMHLAFQDWLAALSPAQREVLTRYVAGLPRHLRDKNAPFHFCANKATLIKEFPPGLNFSGPVAIHNLCAYTQIGEFKFCCTQAVSIDCDNADCPEDDNHFRDPICMARPFFPLTFITELNASFFDARLNHYGWEKAPRKNFVHIPCRFPDEPIDEYHRKIGTILDANTVEAPRSVNPIHVDLLRNGYSLYCDASSAMTDIDMHAIHRGATFYIKKIKIFEQKKYFAIRDDLHLYYCPTGSTTEMRLSNYDLGYEWLDVSQNGVAFYEAGLGYAKCKVYDYDEMVRVFLNHPMRTSTCTHRNPCLIHSEAARSKSKMLSDWVSVMYAHEAITDDEQPTITDFLDSEFLRDHSSLYRLVKGNYIAQDFSLFNNANVQKVIFSYIHEYPDKKPHKFKAKDDDPRKEEHQKALDAQAKALREFKYEFVEDPLKKLSDSGNLCIAVGPPGSCKSLGARCLGKEAIVIGPYADSLKENGDIYYDNWTFMVAAYKLKEFRDNVKYMVIDEFQAMGPYILYPLAWAVAHNVKVLLLGDYTQVSGMIGDSIFTGISKPDSDKIMNMVHANSILRLPHNLTRTSFRMGPEAAELLSALSKYQIRGVGRSTFELITCKNLNTAIIAAQCRSHLPSITLTRDAKDVVLANLSACDTAAASGGRNIPEYNCFLLKHLLDLPFDNKGLPSHVIVALSRATEKVWIYAPEKFLPITEKMRLQPYIVEPRSFRAACRFLGPFSDGLLLAGVVPPSPVAYNGLMEHVTIVRTNKLTQNQVRSLGRKFENGIPITADLTYAQIAMIAKSAKKPEADVVPLDPNRLPIIQEVISDDPNFTKHAISGNRVTDGLQSGNTTAEAALISLGAPHVWFDYLTDTKEEDGVLEPGGQHPEDWILSPSSTGQFHESHLEVAKMIIDSRFATVSADPLGRIPIGVSSCKLSERLANYAGARVEYNLYEAMKPPPDRPVKLLTDRPSCKYQFDNPFTRLDICPRRYGIAPFETRMANLSPQERKEKMDLYMMHFTTVAETIVTDSHDSLFRKLYITNEDFVELIVKHTIDFLANQANKGSLLRPPSVEELYRSCNEYTHSMKTQYKAADDFQAFWVHMDKGGQPVQVGGSAWVHLCAGFFRAFTEVLHAAMGPRVQFMGPGFSIDKLFRKLRIKFNFKKGFGADVRECDASHIPIFVWFVGLLLRRIAPGISEGMVLQLQRFIHMFMDIWFCRSRDGFVKATVLGQLASGSPWTFIWNCLWSMFNLFSLVLEKYGLDGLRRFVDEVVIGVAGDDMVFSCNSDEFDFETGTVITPFDVQLKMSAEPGAIVFCHYTFTEEAALPDPFRLLAKKISCIYTDVDSLDDMRKSVFVIMNRYRDPRHLAQLCRARKIRFGDDEDDTSTVVDLLLRICNTPPNKLLNLTKEYTLRYFFQDE